MPKGKPFQPGKSGNPGGRPKGLAGFRERLQELDERAHIELATLITDDDPKVRLEAIKHVHGYLYGKPTQAVELTGKDGEAMQTELKVDHAATAKDFASALSHALRAGILGGAAGLSAPGAQPEDDEVHSTGPHAAPAGVSGV